MNKVVKRKKEIIKKLEMEIQVKDYVIKELMVLLTNNKIKLPDVLLKNINILFPGEK